MLHPRRRDVAAKMREACSYLGANHQRRTETSGNIIQKPAPEKLGAGYFLRFFETQNDDVMVVGVALPKLVDDT